jgi:hypothetical protein
MGSKSRLRRQQKRVTLFYYTFSTEGGQEMTTNLLILISDYRLQRWSRRGGGLTTFQLMNCSLPTIPTKLHLDSSPVAALVF